ncbi:COX15/CtaA family protein [Miltoncostaea marina]|uniref:COX15/CtaA family protein n=1 Tax=Miltoncostaea marina TaxID=2843215 RepID=UPI001C3D4410|nr:COX15/CtaA family protein [Miltoncostaea marina]
MALLRSARTPAGFAWITLVALAMLWIIVPSGAIVRLTDSGLGCPDWPLCEGRVVSASAHHALIESTNRVLSGIVGVVAVVTFLAALWLPGAPRGLRALAGGLALATALQIPLGAITVASGLHPMAVGAHFLLSMVALALATLLAIRARDHRDGRARRWEPRRGVMAAFVAAAALTVLVTGVVVTAAGPHSGDDDVTERFGDLVVAADVHVKAAFGFTALALVLVAWLWREGGVDRLTRRAAVAAVPLVALQIGLGEYQYRNGLPWEVVVLHVTNAGLVWAAIVALCWGVARPAGAPGHLRREATRWQGTQRTESGSTRNRPSGISEPQSTQIP